MDKDKLWQKVSQEVKSQIGIPAFRTFFSGARIDTITDTKIVIATAAEFLQATIKTRYLSLLESTFEHIVGKKLEVEFTVKLTESYPEEIEPEEFFQPVNITHTPIINPKFTLENFVVGPTNNVAFAGAQAVAENPGTSYNPLFIYGGTGVGKTHLMLGIGNKVLEKNPTAKIIYCSSEQFMNDYVAAIQNHKMGDLRAKYRQAHLLLIDDIQFFSGREGTQEEFFHTFNELQAKNSQMVITSDRPPQDIAKLEDRLRSRFAGGLMVDIQAPDFDTRVAILKAKSLQWGTMLPDDSLRLIASTPSLSIRELEGKLLQIIQSIKARNLTPTPDNIASYLNVSKKPLSLTHAQVITTICRYFNLSAKDLTGPKRQKGFVLPRHITMYILSEDLGLTVEKIGEILGGRDHTTVMHGRDKIKQLINNDRETQRMFTEIKQQLSTQ